MVKYTDVQSMINDGITLNLENLPNCVLLMKREFVEYVVGESLTYDYPVLEIFSNPRKSMQGGFISAAFDNSFGSLVHLITKEGGMVTLDLNVTYVKPIFENDVLTTKVYLKSQGKTIIHMYGEGYDRQKNLIATATTNIMLLRKK